MTPPTTCRTQMTRCYLQYPELLPTSHVTWPMFARQYNNIFNTKFSNNAQSITLFSNQSIVQTARLSDSEGHIICVTAADPVVWKGGRKAIWDIWFFTIIKFNHIIKTVREYIPQTRTEYHWVIMWFLLKCQIYHRCIIHQALYSQMSPTFNHNFMPIFYENSDSHFGSFPC